MIIIMIMLIIIIIMFFCTNVIPHASGIYTFVSICIKTNKYIEDKTFKHIDILSNKQVEQFFVHLLIRFNAFQNKS